MSKELKLTPWFPGHIKPERVGVYQQYNGWGEIGYQRWDGRRWHSWSNTPNGAANTVFLAALSFQNDKWRGLAAKP